VVVVVVVGRVVLDEFIDGTVPIGSLEASGFGIVGNVIVLGAIFRLGEELGTRVIRAVVVVVVVNTVLGSSHTGLANVVSPLTFTSDRIVKHMG